MNSNRAAIKYTEKRLQKHSKYQQINLSKEEGFKNIKECLATFSLKEVVLY